MLVIFNSSLHFCFCCVLWWRWWSVKIYRWWMFLLVWCWSNRNFAEFVSSCCSLSTVYLLIRFAVHSSVQFYMQQVSYTILWRLMSTHFQLETCKCVAEVWEDACTKNRQRRPICCPPVCCLSVNTSIQSIHAVQRQDTRVANVRSNRNVFNWRLNALWSVKSWSSAGNAFHALDPACEKQHLPILSRVVSGS